MKRFEDSPELFGIGSGRGTCGDIRCDICEELYNEGADESEDYSGDSVTWTDFAGMSVCFCCFGKIEQEVLFRMPAILTWYKRILEAKRTHLEKAEKLLEALKEQPNDKDKLGR